VAALDVSFLGTQAISSVCAARASGEAGSFQIARYRGLPASPEDLLLAFDEPEDSGIDVVSRAQGSGASEPREFATASPATPALAAGALALREGKAGAAEQRFSEAAAALGSEGDAALRSDALRGLGQAQQAQGHYGEARENFGKALALAQQSGDAAREARILSHLGSTQVAMRDSQEAEESLVRGLGVAKTRGDLGLSARLETDLGNERAAREQWREALARYEAAAQQAHAAGRAESEATALASAARAAIEARDFDQAKSLLGRAELALTPITGLAAVNLGIHLGKSYELLVSAASDPAVRAQAIRHAYTRLSTAADGAKTSGDARLASFALGNLASLYESEHRHSEALYLIRQAVAAAEASEAPDALYRWYWQEGRILWAQGQAESALASYRRAVEIVEATRQTSLAHYGSASLRFERAVAPVYRDYVEALLGSSDLVANPRAAHQLLAEARETMEQFQAAELRDYFRDACVADIEARTVDLDRVLRERAPHTAVVYPIALDHQLELLVSLQDGLERYSVPVSAATIDAEVARLRGALARPIGRMYEPPSEQLYRWLVAPYEKRLHDAGIETLVFVPLGSLRTIPFGALYDGEKFLLERYALAVTPGLSLVDPHALHAEAARFLLAGLSQGGEFAGKSFDALPMVREEIGAIQKLYGGEVLLDASFDAPEFRRAVVEEQPTVVHVASHAYFGAGPDDSFLLTHDGAVTFDQLGAMVGPRRYTEAPLELLVLSACETAAGDDKAALGLAGVAIRSGARSAIGSLWAIPTTPPWM
jgi:CHAT domain-containing protein